VLVILAILSLFFALIVSIFINDLFALSEVLLDFIIRGNISLHPWVIEDLVDCDTLAWITIHHFLEHILELR